MSAGTMVLVLATAYAPGCGASGLTRTGTHPAAHHTIAVDPRVIPLGSIVLVDGFEGELLAEDTGSAILGHHLDLYMGTCGEAVRFGVQRRRAVVVHVPKGRR